MHVIILRPEYGVYPVKAGGRREDRSITHRINIAFKAECPHLLDNLNPVSIIGMTLMVEEDETKWPVYASFCPDRSL
jgi:hypothetical protein